MMEILRYSAGSVAWGFIIGLLCLTLFFVMIKGWWKDARFGCSSYLIGFVLGILLIYRCILICGSVAIIKVSNHSEPVLTEIVNQYSDNAEKVLTPEESDKIIKDFALRNPLVAHYIDGGEFEGYTARELPHAIIDELKNYMGWFIFRRVLWSLGLTILSAFLVIKTISRKYESRSHERTDRSRQSVSRSDRSRISTRRRR